MPPEEDVAGVPVTHCASCGSHIVELGTGGLAAEPVCYECLPIVTFPCDQLPPAARVGIIVGGVVAWFARVLIFGVVFYAAARALLPVGVSFWKAMVLVLVLQVFLRGLPPTTVTRDDFRDWVQLEIRKKRKGFSTKAFVLDAALFKFILPLALFVGAFLLATWLGSP